MQAASRSDERFRRTQDGTHRHTPLTLVRALREREGHVTPAFDSCTLGHAGQQGRALFAMSQATQLDIKVGEGEKVGGRHEASANQSYLAYSHAA